MIRRRARSSSLRSAGAGSNQLHAEVRVESKHVSELDIEIVQVLEQSRILQRPASIG
jgi:hypothetical protein